MRSIRSVALAVLLCALVPATARPQAQIGLSSLRVRYNRQKNTVKPQGELKAQIDEVDKQIAEASGLGGNAELRRLFAKGTTLLSGRPWTDVLDFTNSLVLRADRVIVDSTRPYSVRIESYLRSVVSSPTAEVMPGCGGTMTSGIESCAATSAP